MSKYKVLDVVIVSIPKGEGEKSIADVLGDSAPKEKTG